ncbi:helix-turn-helix domain-containing protein [Planctomycetota bacterium]
MMVANEKNIVFTTSSVLPDGNGGFTPSPELLTEDEAIRYLRLDTIEIKHPDDTLRRYREAGVLQGVQISKKVFYPRSELERFIKQQMEKNPR